MASQQFCRKIRFVLAAISLLLAAGVTHAQQNVFLDFADLRFRLNDAAFSAGLGPNYFSTFEADTVATKVLATTSAAYSQFDILATQSTPASPFTSILFGWTAPNAVIQGEAPYDFRNQIKSESAFVYTENFGYALNGPDKSTNIDQIALALGTTAAHELGHTLGLDHYDAYGDPRITPANYANTNDAQNTHIMATTATGLTNAQRLTPRNFGPLELAKLEFADDLNPTPPASQQEVPVDHSTPASAQPITLSPMRTTPGTSANLTGGIVSEIDSDMYRFSASAGELVTINVIPQAGGSLDAGLSLFAGDGVTLLASSANVYFSGNLFAAGSLQSLSPLILNVPILLDDTYFIQVTGAGLSPIGGYNLFLTATPVPEPAALSLLAAFFLPCFRRRAPRSTRPMSSGV